MSNLIIDAIRKLDNYSRGEARFTTTELVLPERILALTAKHKPEIHEESSVWQVMGSALHQVLKSAAEMVDPSRFITEQRFQATLPDGTVISSQIDVYDRKTKTLDNYKVCSVWKFILQDSPEWEQQLNIEAYVLRMNDLEVSHVRNIAFLRDWNARKARTTKQGDYPPNDIHEVEVKLWTIAEQQEWIMDRVSKHDAAATGETPLCSKKERWQRNASVAVMKKGRKSAIRVMDDEDRAYAMMRQLERNANPGEKFYLEERPSEPVRCLSYCPVNKWCPYGIEAIAKWKKDE
jgi:hypothetical protein